MRLRLAGDRLALPWLCALAIAAVTCRSRDAGKRADSTRVSVDSGAVSPLPPPAATPAIGDTGVEKKPVASTAAETTKVPTVPAGAALPPSQVPPVTPPAHTAAKPAPNPRGADSAHNRPLADSAQAARTTSLTPAPSKSAAPEPPKTSKSTRAFVVGEKLDYQVKFSSVSVGTATMEVLGLEDVRGSETYHTLFNVRGGVPFYRVNDRYESWFDPETYASYRFNQNIDEGSYEAKRNYEIFPERKTFSENGKEEQTSVANPLDEASLIYLLRTMPLEVGKTYDLDRYFKPDRNPVRVEVVRKERITVPAGTFNTIVVHPIIKTKGIFSEGGHAEVWFSDDSVRMMVQMKSQLKIGSLNLYLKSIRAGAHP